MNEMNEGKAIEGKAIEGKAKDTVLTFEIVEVTHKGGAFGHAASNFRAYLKASNGKVCYPVKLPYSALIGADKPTPGVKVNGLKVLESQWGKFFEATSVRYADVASLKDIQARIKALESGAARKATVSNPLAGFIG